VVPNRGRDVLPFLTVVGRIRELGQYEYLLKLHTKKSLHRKDGAKWLDELLSTLLPEDTNLILERLNDEKTGVSISFNSPIGNSFVPFSIASKNTTVPTSSMFKFALTSKATPEVT
jgi:hypothetical protein